MTVRLFGSDHRLLEISVAVVARTNEENADPSADPRLRPLACRDCVFESRRGHGCLSLVFFVVK
jgi:hypothetical protein